MNKLHIASLTDKPEFLEASKEELRVLLALIEGAPNDKEYIAQLCRISRARANAALSFWLAAGVIGNDEPTITEEFEDRLRRGEIAEEESVAVAQSIRDNGLNELLSECAALMKKTALSTTEVKKLTALYTQYSVNEEYILTLAAYMADKSKLTATRLADEAIRLIDKGIDTSEALGEYIMRLESESGTEREFRKLFGIYNRTLTDREKAYFKKWSEDYGYFTEIVGEAYDICVNATSKLSLPYIDKILASWFAASCNTVSECRAFTERARQEKTEVKRARSAEKKKAVADQKERYGDFNVGDAFKKALERSYGKDGN